jgi:hypothetical protein
VLRPISLCRHAVALTPVGPQAGSARSPCACDGGLPRVSAGSAPTSNVSRPARRSRTLRPACSRGRLAALSIRSFGSIVTSTTVPIATGWSDSCRVGIAPTEDRRLCTAHTDTDYAEPGWTATPRVAGLDSLFQAVQPGETVSIRGPEGGTDSGDHPATDREVLTGRGALLFALLGAFHGIRTEETESRNPCRPRRG